MKQVSKIGYVTLLRAAFLISSVLMGSACGEAEEAIDNFDSRLVCQDYCGKKFDCQDQNATDAENDACVGACRSSIEDNCGNDNQAAANDKIGKCVDKGCTDFWACMVFETAPECFGFVD